MGLFLAPMRGQQMRRFVSERVQNLLGYFPDTASVKQAAQQVVAKASQGVNDLQTNAQQIPPHIRDAADHRSNAVQPTTSVIQHTGKDPDNAVQQKAATSFQHMQENASLATDTAASEEIKSHNDPLERMQSVPPEVREKLEAEGIQSTPQLLENAQTQAERAELANKVGVSRRVLREFTYRADLMRLTHLDEDTASGKVCVSFSHMGNATSGTGACSRINGISAKLASLRVSKREEVE
jgi:gas vesicle protein